MWSAFCIFIAIKLIEKYSIQIVELAWNAFPIYMPKTNFNQKHIILSDKKQEFYRQKHDLTRIDMERIIKAYILNA